jgi:Uri superfamily endonuclease
MIEIIKESKDKLFKKGYLFYVSSEMSGSNVIIYLDRYLEAERLTKRQKYQTQRNWHRTMSRDNSITNEEIKLILTPEIIAEVKEIIKKSIDNLVIKI